MTLQSIDRTPFKDMFRRQLRVLRLSERNLARSNARAASEREEILRNERNRVEREIYKEEYEVLALSMDDIQVEEFMSWLPKARRNIAEARRREARARIDMLYALTTLELALDSVEQVKTDDVSSVKNRMAQPY